MRNPTFVALDTVDRTEAVAMAQRLNGLFGGVKLGLELVNANGPEGVRAVAAAGQKLFLDLRFHDIPNTVARAVRALVPLASAILNVLASGGAAMMRAAREAADDAAREAGLTPPLVIAVTVLTSLDDADLEAVGQQRPAEAACRILAEIGGP